MTTTGEPQLIEPLTPREQVVLEHLCKGLTNRQIADELGISADGVKFHVSSILGKLAVRSRHEAAYWPEQAPWWAGGIAPVLFWWRRTAPAIGAKISTTTAWLAGGALFATMAGLALLAVLFMRGREATNDAAIEALLLIDAAALVAQSSIKMNALDSYHVRFSVPAHPEDVREEHRWEFDFVQPDDFRYLLYHAEGVQKEVCETHGQGRTCTFILTSITERSRYEVLYVSEFSYWRQCDGKGDNCDDWEREARPELPMIGPSPTSWPQWPIVALEMIDAAEAIEASRINGVETVRLRGTVSMIRAVLENLRRVLTAAGMTSFGETCSSGGVAMNVEGDSLTCRDLSFEEMLANNEDSIAFQDENPATVDVWISPEDGRLHRLQIAGPVEDSGEPSTVEFTIEYSEFNEARVEAPV